MLEKEFILPSDLIILSRSDLLGNITGYNEGFREASGYTDTELMGAAHSLLRHPDVPKVIFSDCWRTIQSGRTWSDVIKNRRKDGLFYWVFAHVTPIIEDGKIVGYVSVRYPVTLEQKKQAERYYKDVNAGLCSVSNSHTHSLSPYVTKQDVVIGGISIFISGLLVMLGIDSSSMLLATLGLMNLGFVGYFFVQLIRSRKPNSNQLYVINQLSNGDFRMLVKGEDAWSLTLNSLRVRLAEFSALRYDAKKILKEKADMLAEASRYKSEFLANMGHELRTPLNSINVLAGLLQQNSTGNLTKQQVEQLQVIHYAGRDLLDLINDLLDFSKIEAGKMSVVVETTDIKKLVREMHNMFRPLIEDKGLSLSLVMNSSLPLIVTDSAKVRQIIKNFMSNAMKFTDVGGITLEVVRSESSRFVIEIRVHDTGCGIPLNQQEEIFESFRQGDGTISRKYGGTGLGLSISRQLANLLGASVFVQSTPDEGATFSVLLPAQVSIDLLKEQGIEVINLDDEHHKKSLASQATNNDQSTVKLFVRQEEIVDDPACSVTTSVIPIKSSTLLLIDDDAMFVASIRNVLKQLGVNCLHAANPREGMMMAAQYQPDGILLGWHILALSDDSIVIQMFQDNPNTRQIPLKVLTNDLVSNERWVRDVASEVILPKERSHIAQLVADLINGRQVPVAMFLLVGQYFLRERILTNLNRCMSETEWVVYDHAEDALNSIDHQDEDGIVVMDMFVSDMSPFDFLDQLLQYHPNWSVIVYVDDRVEWSVIKRLGMYSDVLALKVCDTLPKLIDWVALWLRHPVRHCDECPLADPIVGVERSVSLAGREILIVDNDVRNLYSLRALLEAHEMKVVMAYSANEALTLLRQDVFVQAVITDIMMPDVNGYELIGLIRENPQWDTLPILALTAKVGAQERLRCLAVGANDYLSKPVDEVMLLSLLRGLVAQQPGESETLRFALE